MKKNVDLIDNIPKNIKEDIRKLSVGAGISKDKLEKDYLYILENNEECEFISRTRFGRERFSLAFAILNRRYKNIDFKNQCKYENVTEIFYEGYWHKVHICGLVKNLMPTISDMCSDKSSCCRFIKVVEKSKRDFVNEKEKKK